MNTGRLFPVIMLGTFLACVGGMPVWSLASPASTDSPAAIEGATYRLEPAYLITVHVPNEIVDKVLKSVVAAVGLAYGNYDQVAFLEAPGREQFRPRDGSKAGAMKKAVRIPTTSVSFSVPHDTAALKDALDAIYKAHSYEEPVVYVSDVWRTRSTAPDETNPNRWWNEKSR
jgi:hypothetical protein